MDPFRWLLIILGLLLIAAIYAWGRWQDKKHARRAGRYEDYNQAFDAMDSAVGGPDDFEVIVKKPRRQGEDGAEGGQTGGSAGVPDRERRREPTGLDADLDWADDDRSEPQLGLDGALDDLDEPASGPSHPRRAGTQQSTTPASEPTPEPEPRITQRHNPRWAPARQQAPDSSRDREGADVAASTAGGSGPAREPAAPSEPPVRDRPDLAALGANGPAGRDAREASTPELPAGPQVDLQAADLEDKIVAIHVAAPEGHVFAADALVDALQRAGLEYGEHGIFHRQVRTERGPARVFSVANMIKPGWFDLDRVAQDETPGAAFFLQLPGPVDGMAAFDDMLGVARRVADDLGGRLLDGRRCDLSRQAMAHIREELREYRRRLHLAARKQQG